MKPEQVLPPTYLHVSIASMVLLHFLIPVTKIAAFPWNLLGLVPLIAGIALNLLANSAFEQTQTVDLSFIA